LEQQRVDALARGDAKAATLLDRMPERHVGKRDWHKKQGRFEENLNIVRSNYERADKLALNLRVVDAKVKQQRHRAKNRSLSRDGNNKFGPDVFDDWQRLSKGEHKLPTIEKSDDYFEALQGLLHVMQKPYPSQHIENQRTCFDDLLDEIFKQHVQYLTSFEKLLLVMAYADISQNVKAGRSTYLQKSFLRKKTGKILKQAYGRRRERSRQRYRGRRPSTRKR